MADRNARTYDRRNSFLVSAVAGTEPVLEATVRKNYFLLRLNDYEVSKENLERKLLDQSVNLKAVTASVKQPEKSDPVGE